MEIVRNVTRHKLRSFLTISGIVIGVLALTTMGALAENFNALLDGGVKYFGSSIQVGPPDGTSAPLLPISKVDEIKQVAGVGAAFPTYSFQAKPGSAPSFSFGVPDTIVAGDPAENDGPGRPRLDDRQGVRQEDRRHHRSSHPAARRQARLRQPHVHSGRHPQRHPDGA